MMKIVIAPDKFKDCLSAPRVADAIAAGVLRARPDARIDQCPMADGGEGTVAALVAATGGRLMSRRVTGPLPHMRVEATFGMLGDGMTAVVEMAAASGLALLRAEERDPMKTTTYGTGELLLAAAEAGATQIILGIGGSATCDGGLGCAQAVGSTSFTLSPLEGEAEGATANLEPLCGRDVGRVVLARRGRGSPVDQVRITVACDVTNPLYGPAGAAPVFGPQKGATAEQVRRLDEDLRALAGRLGKDDLALVPGAGAAGGLGFGMLAFFGAALRPGIEIVINAARLRERLRAADLCITAEGRLDGQSLGGKTPIGVARLCREMNVPCVALAGSIEADARAAYAEGLDAFFSICPRPMPLEQAIADAPELLARAAENLVRAATCLRNK